MKIEMTRIGEAKIEYMFTVAKKSDIGEYFKQTYSTVKGAKVSVGNILTLTGDFNDPIPFQMKCVKSFNHSEQLPKCLVLDLMGGPQYAIKTIEQAPSKFYNLSVHISNDTARYMEPDKDWVKSWGIDLELVLVQQCADTYVLETLHRTNPDVMAIQIMFQDHIRRLSGQFANYLDMVIGGELRHAYNQTNQRDMSIVREKSPVHAMLVDLLRGIPFIDSYALCDNCADYQEDDDCEQICNLDTCGHKSPKKTPKEVQKFLGSREVMWYAWHALREEHGLPLLAAANDVFNECRWCSSFGGMSWGNMSKALIRYYEKGYAPEDSETWKNNFHFIDNVWSLQHNGGNALNKVWVVPIALARVLNVKFSSRTDDLVRHCSKGVIDTWVKRTGKTVTVPRRIMDLL